MAEELYNSFDRGLYRLVEVSAPSYEIDPDRISAGSLVSVLGQNIGTLQSGKIKFANTETGYILGVDGGTPKFYIGTTTNYFNFDGTSITIAGSLTATTITGGTFQTATSGKRVRIVSASATTPSQNANSFGLIDSSDNLTVQIGSESSVLVTIQPFTDVTPLNIYSNVAQAANLLTVTMDNSSATGTGILLTQDGSGKGIEVISSSGGGSPLKITKQASTAAVAFELNQATTGDGIEINMSGAGICFDVNKTNTGAGIVFDIDNAGTGITLDISQSESTNASPAILASNAGTTVVAQFSNTGSTSTAAVITLTNDTTISDHFKRYIQFESANIIWRSYGTTPNGNLSGSAGDVCLNCDSSKMYYCTGTTNWTAM